MKKEKFIKEFAKVVNDLNENDLIELHNAYCQAISNHDNEIFQNDEDFFETFFQNASYSLVQRIFYGDYNFSHEWIKFDGYGNLETIWNRNGILDCMEYPETIADYVFDNPQEFYLNIEELNELIEKI